MSNSNYLISIFNLSGKDFCDPGLDILNNFFGIFVVAKMSVYFIFITVF
jgi:hypothetical protein